MLQLTKADFDRLNLELFKTKHQANLYLEELEYLEYKILGASNNLAVYDEEEEFNLYETIREISSHLGDNHA